jgi:molecular chaperone DnaK
MGLVAQGAAVYAVTAGLEARPAPVRSTGRRLWLQYPAMSSDLAPFVVGRLLPGPGDGPTEVRLVRDGWSSPWTALDAEGGLVLQCELLPRRPNSVAIEGRDARGQPVAVDPASISIVQGMTLSDPPLSRSIGVALADDVVQVYVERGAPLPARRTFRHRTVDAVPAGLADAVIRIPIVQGEFRQAHLCRVVGILEIDGRRLADTLPAGAEVEITIEVDRGGQMQARAQLLRTGQVFEQVARLVVPEADPAALGESIVELRSRLHEARRRTAEPRQIDRLYDVEWWLTDAEAALTAFRGGEEDAGQRARRLVLDADAALEAFEVERAWPELERELTDSVASASRVVAEHGTVEEQRLVAQAAEAARRAHAARQAPELQRQVALLTRLRSAAFYRSPRAWNVLFESTASDVSRARDLPRAQALVQAGWAAAERGDRDELRRVTQDLWELMPVDLPARRLGHDSGVR